jgi:hypothetical protein
VLLEAQEGIFDQMPQFIEVAIEISLLLAMASGRNLHLHAGLPGAVNQGVSVKALVSDKMLGIKAFN